jgi:hypothetical protein
MAHDHMTVESPLSPFTACSCVHHCQQQVIAVVTKWHSFRCFISQTEFMRLSRSESEENDGDRLGMKQTQKHAFFNPMRCCRLLRFCGIEVKDMVCKEDFTTVMMILALRQILH